MSIYRESDAVVRDIHKRLNALGESARPQWSVEKAQAVALAVSLPTALAVVLVFMSWCFAECSKDITRSEANASTRKSAAIEAVCVAHPESSACAILTTEVKK